MARGEGTPGSFEIHLDRIGGLAVHGQHQVDFAAPDQSARYLDIDLIEADAGSWPGILKPGRVKRKGRHVADACGDCAQAGAIAEAGAEQFDHYDFTRWAKINLAGGAV